MNGKQPPRRGSGRRSRRKGSTFEREVARAFEAAGWHIRGLESGGDHLCLDRSGRLLHVECKRQEILRLPLWTRQLERDKADNLDGVIVYRQSHQPAYAVMRLDQYLRQMGGDDG